MDRSFMFFPLVLAVTVFPCSAEDGVFNGQWVDLTHEFSEQTIYWPTAESFSKATVFEVHTEVHCVLLLS